MAGYGPTIEHYSDDDLKKERAVRIITEIVLEVLPKVWIAYEYATRCEGCSIETSKLAVFIPTLIIMLVNMFIEHKKRIEGREIFLSALVSFVFAFFVANLGDIQAGGDQIEFFIKVLGNNIEAIVKIFQNNLEGWPFMKVAVILLIQQISQIVFNYIFLDARQPLYED